MIFKRKTKGEGRYTIYIHTRTHAHTHVRAGVWAGIRTDGFKPDITCKKPHSSGLVITTTKRTPK